MSVWAGKREGFSNSLSFKLKSSEKSGTLIFSSLELEEPGLRCRSRHTRGTLPRWCALSSCNHRFPCPQLLEGPGVEKRELGAPSYIC